MAAAAILFLQKDASNGAAYSESKKPEITAKKQDGDGRHLGFTQLAIT